MSDKRTLYLQGPEQRQRAFEAIAAAPKGSKVVVSDPNRSLDQNAAQWPILQAFADQLLWPVNGQMVQMTDDEWKDVLTAAFKGETVRLAQGLNGGVVMLGQRTSKFSKGKFSEWLEFLHAVAVERGVEVYAESVGAEPGHGVTEKPYGSTSHGRRRTLAHEAGSDGMRRNKRETEAIEGEWKDAMPAAEEATV